MTPKNKKTRPHYIKNSESTWFKTYKGKLESKVIIFTCNQQVLYASF